MEGLFASPASLTDATSDDYPLAREVWQTLHVSKASLRNGPAAKMDDDLAARFFSWHHNQILEGVNIPDRVQEGFGYFYLRGHTGVPEGA
jgi:hypothetical protein